MQEIYLKEDILKYQRAKIALNKNPIFLQLLKPKKKRLYLKV